MRHTSTNSIPQPGANFPHEKSRARMRRRFRRHGVRDAAATSLDVAIGRRVFPMRCWAVVGGLRRYRI